MLFWGAIFIFLGMGYGGSVKMCTFSALKGSLYEPSLDTGYFCVFLINFLFDSSIVVWGEESLSGQMLWHKAL